MSVHRVRATVSRVLVYTHRWLGILLGILFASWFVSGIVLMYVGMPSLAAAERRAREPVLDFSSATISPAQAAQVAGGAPDAVQLGMLLDRPVYRLRAAGRTQTIFADNGQRLEGIDSQQALAEARTFAPEHASTVRYDAYVTEPDQWMLEIRRQLPAHRVALGDADDSRLYISATTGEPLLKTSASTRRWAYPGAILHWIYFTPIRRHADAWAQFIIWTSVVGTVMCLVGFGWGLWRYSPRERYRLKRHAAHSPYAGWMWWHHYAGIVFGAVTITWIFSGLLSMDPWDWHPGTSPTREQRLAFSGGPFNIEHVAAADIVRAIEDRHGAREADIVQVNGQLRLATDRGIAALHAGGVPHPLDVMSAGAMAAAAMPGTPISDVTLLDDYDSYYYDRDRDLPLPVLRIRYADAQRTWLYVDANRGTVLRKEERLSRLNRWLYHGLHSLDFPFLYYRRPLWDAVVIALSLGGLALTLTTVVPVFRRARRHARHLRAHAD